MKYLAFTIALIAASAAFAADVTKFDCRTTDVIEGRRTTRIQFSVENLGKKNAGYFTADPDDTDPVVMTPKYSILGLNDNWQIKQKDDRLQMSADGDGCSWTDFVLYKSSGYKRGWVRVKDTGCGASPAYSTVICTID